MSHYEILNPPLTNAAARGRTVGDLLALVVNSNYLRILSELIHFYDADSTQPHNGEFLGLPFGSLGQPRTDQLTRCAGATLVSGAVSGAVGATD